MPRSSGTYSLPAGNPVVTGTTISATTHNSTLSDISTELTNSLPRDGQASPTANIPMGGFKLTGMGNGSARTDSASLGQIQDSAYLWLSSVSGSDTITASVTPNMTAYASGQSFWFVSAGANTGAVTININSIGAKSITKQGSTVLAAGDIPSGSVCQITYDGTRFQLSNVYTVSAAQLVDSVIYDLNTVTAASGDYVSIADVSDSNKKKKALISDIAAMAANTAVRQSINGGPVTSAGLSDFLPASAAGLSVTSQNVTSSAPLVVSAAGGYGTSGDANRVGYSSTNLTWSSLTNTATNYLYVDVGTDGALTTGATTTAPVYQYGGTYSTTAGANTFNISEMTMKAGDGGAANKVWRVFVGEAVASGGNISSTVAYAYRGHYESAWTSTLPGMATKTDATHNIGVVPAHVQFEIECLSADGNFATGDRLGNITTSSAGNQTSIVCGRTYKTAWMTTGTSAAFYAANKTTGANFTLTAANWKYRFVAFRGW